MIRYLSTLRLSMVMWTVWLLVAGVVGGVAATLFAQGSFHRSAPSGSPSAAVETTVRCGASLDQAAERSWPTSGAGACAETCELEESDEFTPEKLAGTVGIDLSSLAAPALLASAVGTVYPNGPRGHSAEQRPPGIRTTLLLI